MKTGKIIAGVAAFLTGAVSPALFIDPDIVCCEKVYDVKLSAETVEIDINDIPENREVQVGISIDNNPGFIGLHYFIELDSKLLSKQFFAFDFDSTKFSLNNGYLKNGSVMDIDVIYNNYELDRFSENTNLFYLKLILPEDAKPGDYYSVKPFYFYQDDSKTSEAFFRQENTFESYFGYENFAESNIGGIRITGQSNIEEPHQPEIQEQPVSSQEEHHESQQQNEPHSEIVPQQNKNEETSLVSETDVSVTSAVSTVSSSAVSVTEHTAETSETTGITEVSETVSVTERTEETKVSEVSAKEKTEKKNYTPFAAGAVITAAVAAVTAVIVSKRRQGEGK